MKHPYPAKTGCNEVRRLFELYADSEGDAATFQKVNQHLAECAGCSAWFESQLLLESRVGELMRADSPSATLWAGIEGRVRTTSRWNWALLRLMTASAAVVLVALSGWFLNTPDIQAPNDLAALAVDEHERLASGNLPLQISSDSDLEVEDYLKRRVDFPVRCPPRQDAGFMVQGGGVCSLGATPAAFVHGTIGDGKSSIFILPREALQDFGPERSRLSQANVLYHRKGSVSVVLSAIDQNVVIVVGPESEAHLSNRSHPDS